MGGSLSDYLLGMALPHQVLLTLLLAPGSCPQCAPYIARSMLSPEICTRASLSSTNPSLLYGVSCYMMHTHSCVQSLCSPKAFAAFAYVPFTSPPVDQAGLGLQPHFSPSSAVLVVVLVTVINTVSKGKLGRKGFLWLILPGHNASLREVKAGTQSRNHRGKLLTGSS